MKLTRSILLFLVVVWLSQPGSAYETRPESDLHWCPEIPAFKELQEARFSAVYTFELNQEHRPVHIRQASVPLIAKRDEAIRSCIGSWIMNTEATRGTATFYFYWGWKNFVVVSGDRMISVPAQLVSPDSR